MNRAKIRVLILLESFEIGGAQKMVLELIKELDRSVLDVKILCTGKKLENTLEREVEAILPVDYMGLKGKLTLKGVFSVVRKVSSYEPDVVHSHLGGNAYALVWKILTGGKLIITAHTEAKKAFSKLSEKLVRFLLRSDGFMIATVSAENYKAFCEYYDATEHNCVSINNGVSIKSFGRKTHEGFTYIHVARQDPNKNQQMILNAFTRLHLKYNNTRLILLGDGPERQNILQMIDSIGNAKGVITAPGNVSNTQDYYAVADCYVQASYREAMPLSVLEAMATGMPIISTDVGGLRDVVKPQNGFLIPPGDEKALYQAMLDVYEMDSQLYNTMAQKSKEIVKGYSSSGMAERYMNVYRKMLKRGK